MTENNLFNHNATIRVARLLGAYAVIHKILQDYRTTEVPHYRSTWQTGNLAIWLGDMPTAHQVMQEAEACNDLDTALRLANRLGDQEAIQRLRTALYESGEFFTLYALAPDYPRLKDKIRIMTTAIIKKGDNYDDVADAGKRAIKLGELECAAKAMALCRKHALEIFDDESIDNYIELYNEFAPLIEAAGEIAALLGDATSVEEILDRYFEKVVDEIGDQPEGSTIGTILAPMVHTNPQAVERIVATLIRSGRLTGEPLISVAGDILNELYPNPHP